MSNQFIFSESSDENIRSSDPDYADALAGTGVLEISPENDGEFVMGVGQNHGANYYIHQSFMQFDFTVLPGTVVSACFRLNFSSTSGTSRGRRFEVYEFDWGLNVNTADFRPSDWLQTNVSDTDVITAYIDQSHQAGSGPVRLGIEGPSKLDSSGDKRYVMASSRNRGEVTPDIEEYNWVRTAEQTGTDRDPSLEVTYTTWHALDKILGAQVQLSDGTFAYLEQNNVGLFSTSVDLVHHDGSSPTVIDTIFFSHDIRGAQAMTLVADGSDNLYVIFPRSLDEQIHVEPYKRLSPTSWSDLTNWNFVLQQDHGKINNIVAAWHDVGDEGGVLMVGVLHSASRGAAQDIWVQLECNLFLEGAGNSGQGLFGISGALPVPSMQGYFNPFNDTGTLLDICPVPSNGARGFVVSAERSAVLGEDAQIGVGYYDLDPSSLTSLAETGSGMTNSHAIKDADAKCRIAAVDSTRFLLASACTEDRGLHIRLMDTANGGAPTQVFFQSLHSDVSIPSLPDRSYFAQTPAWDLVYDDVQQQAWIFYFDRNDEHRLMRTRVDLDTGLAAGDEFVVNNSVGASGSTNHAIRVSRGNRTAKETLISVANEDSGGTHSLILVSSVINAFPTTPTLDETPNFDASTDQDFTWTFNDPDSGDSQSAFQLQIEEVGVGLVHDTGKTASSNETYTLSGGTIANNESFQWRVKTWDSEDFEGPWSDYDTFSTANTGIVNITDPPIDNDPNVITADYEVQWDVTNAVQDEYRVVVTRTGDEQLLSDSGWVVSGTQSHLVEGMDTATEYRVEVTIRDSSVDSNTATRLITPDYTFPETPLVTLATGNTYVEVQITNPTPQGDRPAPDVNQIWRRVSGTSDRYLLVGETEPNTSFRDYTVRHDEVYDYFVRAGVEAPELGSTGSSS